MGHDARETPLETGPPDPLAERHESPPTATESAEKGVPGSEPSSIESAVAPQPAEAQTARAAARSPRAPPPVPTRRPLTAPRILSAVEPMLPPGRTAECIGQSVIISLKVGEDGRVLRSRILKSGPEGCSEAARVAAEAYVFEPARDTEGEPVTASTTLNIRFTEVEE